MVVGHQKQLRLLRFMAQTGSLPHALLFSGQEHLGKRTVAFELAKLLYCSVDSVGRPCQQCRFCQDIDKGINPDIILIESRGKQIQIDQIKQVQNSLSLKSAQDNFKVVIIDNAHQMSTISQQAFLKTLEEPRGKTVIILITSKPYLLLPTIRSRVQEIKFFPLAPKEFEDFLRKEKIVGDFAKIMKLSGRRPGVAIDLLSDRKAIQYQERILKDLQALCRSDLYKRFHWSQNVAKNPQQISEILELWLRFFRGLLLVKMGSGRDKVGMFIKSYSLEHLQKIIGVLQEISFAISTSNVNPRLALDVLMLEI